MNTFPKIALGAWAWGNDGTFGGNLTADALRPIRIRSIITCSSPSCLSSRLTSIS